MPHPPDYALGCSWNPKYKNSRKEHTREDAFVSSFEVAFFYKFFSLIPLKFAFPAPIISTR
jgi:hypothetical protein